MLPFDVRSHQVKKISPTHRRVSDNQRFRKRHSDYSRCVGLWKDLFIGVSFLQVSFSKALSSSGENDFSTPG